MKQLTQNRITGNRGEDVACKFLMKQGFSIVERNYLKKWGEIDIVARKDGLIYFIEVKTASLDFDTLRKARNHRPEDNVHSNKVKRLKRVIQTYLAANKISEFSWQFDVIVVYLDENNKKAKVDHLQNNIL